MTTLASYVFISSGYPLYLDFKNLKGNKSNVRVGQLVSNTFMNIRLKRKGSVNWLFEASGYEVSDSVHMSDSSHLTIQYEISNYH